MLLLPPTPYTTYRGPENMEGLVHVYTGDGKGKTTAALGLALRGCGYGMRTAMIQFIKGTWHYGELDGAKQLSGLDIYPMGKGFVGIMGDTLARSEHIKAANGAIEFARVKMMSGEYSTIILDEVNNAIELGILDKEKVLRLLDDRPSDMNMVLTGRDAHPEIIKRADLVSEMTLIKHYYDQGRLAVKGIEY